MFPYYWNGMVFPLDKGSDSIFRRDMGLDNLPDEVREALELHKDEIRNLADRERMIRELNLRK